MDLRNRNAAAAKMKKRESADAADQADNNARASIGDPMMKGLHIVPEAQRPRAASASEAAKSFTFLSLTIVFLQVLCEVTKQISNYSVQYFNNRKYPVPQTVLVMTTECIKLAVTIIRAKGSLPSFSVASLKSSLRFLLPSALYAMNNNIYLLGLTMVSPPLWLILCSMRTAITASVYKFYLKRKLTKLQFLGAFLIVLSIMVAKVPDLLGSAVNSVPISAIFLALLASINSVSAAVYTESQFKGNAVMGETFLDQQFWLYLYGLGVSSVVHFMGNPTYGAKNYIQDVRAMSNTIYLLFLLAVLIGSVGGLVTAAILKFLDNIVKEYAGNLANVVTAAICSQMFPDKFQFTPFITLSLVFLLTGIYLYETEKKKVAMATAAETAAQKNRQEMNGRDN